MKRGFYKKLLLLLLIGVVQATFAKDFGVNNWYALNATRTSITPVDGYCGAIYEFNCIFNNWGPAKFQITEKNIITGEFNPLSAKDLEIGETDDDISLATGDDGISVALEVSKTGGNAENWSSSFYLDVREKPYKLSNSLPTDTFVGALIDDVILQLSEPDKQFGLSINGGDEACTNIDGAIASYQWVMSQDGKTWSDIPGQNESYISSMTQNSDTTYYKLQITYSFPSADGSGDISQKVFETDPAMVYYKSPTVKLTPSAKERAYKFADMEFEVEMGGIVNFRTTSTGFTGDVTYTVQYRPIEGDGYVDEWTDIPNPVSGEVEFAPKKSTEYRVKAVGLSSYSGRETTVYTTNYADVRVRHRPDLNKYTPEYLWSDNFGSFDAPNIYTTDAYKKVAADGTFTLESDTYTSRMETANGEVESIENFWAADPFGHIKQHEYATHGPIYKKGGEDWCTKYRLEDGYYIITTNPIKGDGKKKTSDRDYWDATDHTGNRNGAMLFVNCKPGAERTVIYERPISLNCDMDNATGIWLYFSAYVNDAVYKAGSDNPVNVSWELIDEEGKVVYFAQSGNVYRRKSEMNAESWANVSFAFQATSTNYTLRMYNNSKGGNDNAGNDILVDDISVMLCYPKIEITTKIEMGDEEITQACAGEMFRLKAFNEEGIENFIATPLYQFQYKNKNTEDKWKSYGDQTPNNIKEVGVNQSLQGLTEFRAIVAANESILKTVSEGNEMEVGCDKIFAISAPIQVHLSQSYDMTISPSSIVYCQGLATDFVVNGEQGYKDELIPTKYYWYLNDMETPVAETNEPTYTFAKENFQEVGEHKLAVRAVDEYCQNGEKELAETSFSTVTVTQPSVLTLSLDANTNLSYGETVTITADCSDPKSWAKIDSLVWHTVGSQATITKEKEEYNEFVAENPGETCYYITASAIEDESLCTATGDTVCFKVDMVIPNLITPHNDWSSIGEANNNFLLNKGIKVKIFDRYQELIFEGDNGWDGEFKGKPAEPGTYYYTIEFKNGKTQKGTLEVGKFKE